MGSLVAGIQIDEGYGIKRARESVNYSGGCEGGNGGGILGQANYFKDGTWQSIKSDHSRVRAEFAFLLSTVVQGWPVTVKPTVSKLGRSFKDGYSNWMCSSGF